MRTRNVGVILLIAGMTAILVLPESASASHSVFCQENVSTCSKESQYPAESWLTTTLEGLGVYGELEISGLVGISCTLGKVQGPPQVNEEGPMTGHVAAFWFSQCSPEGCAVNSTLTAEAPWELSATGGGNGSIVISGLVLPVSCSTPNFICTYEAKTISAVFEGGVAEAAFVKGKETSLSWLSGFSCFAREAKLRFRTRVHDPVREGYGTYLTN